MRPALLPQTLAALMLAGCVPSSLKQAVVHNPDEFPPPYAAVVPPSSASALGREPIPDRAPGDLALSGSGCFIVGAVQRASSLQNLRISYRNATTLDAELRYVAVGAGVELSHARRADLDLRNLAVERGYPRPKPGACDFPADQVREIITSQVRAGHADLGFHSDTALKPRVTLPVGSTGGSVEAAAGWQQTSSRALRGTNVVLAALPERYRVEFTHAEHNLGPTPRPGQVFDVGTSSLRVTVLAFDAPTSTLTVRVDAPDIDPVPTDAGPGVCPLGAEQLLPQRQTDPAKPGNNCTFWAYSSGSAAWVQWEPRPRLGTEIQDVVLRVDMYLTRPCTRSTCAQ